MPTKFEPHKFVPVLGPEPVPRGYEPWPNPAPPSSPWSADPNATQSQGVTISSGVIFHLSATTNYGDERNPVLTSLVSGCAITIGVAGCKDFIDGAKPQDAVAIGVCKNGMIVSVVTDGASQSFYGDLAAKLGSKGLCSWIVGMVDSGRSITRDAASLQLAKMENELSHTVSTFHIPDRLPEYKRDFLTESRAKTPSQAVISATIYDPETGDLHYTQLGDSNIRSLLSG